MNVCWNKLDTIKSRAGSVKSTIFLSQSITGKRFGYQDTEKANVPMELTGKLTKHDYSNVYPVNYRPQTTKNEILPDFRNIKLKEHPSSKRTLDNSLQPDPTTSPTRNKAKVLSRCNSKELSFSKVNTARTIQTSLNRTSCDKPYSGRKHNALIFKSFNFQTLNQDLDTSFSNQRKGSGKKTIRVYKKEEQPDLSYRSQKKIIGDQNAATWKNGYWNINKPNDPNLRNVKNETSLNGVKKEKNKYIPISLRTDRNFGRVNYTQTLQIGLVASNIKAKKTFQDINNNKKKQTVKEEKKMMKE